MTLLSSQLTIDACPHCGRANPTLVLEGQPIQTRTHDKKNPRFWGAYACRSCGGLVIAGGETVRDDRPYATVLREVYPSISAISDSIPEKPREFLRQARDSLHAPAGAIMLSASAVDAMLKEKGYTTGSLYQRIDKAAKDHLITNEMALWAHQVRLDANVQRHADSEAPLPDKKEAKLAFDFAVAFAEYLFVLPAKVSRGITDSKTEEPSDKSESKKK